MTPVDGSGVFTDGEWRGQNVFKANPAIVEHLKKVGALLHSETLSHSYPHCWRCHNPLIFLATEQWFINIDHQGLREKMIAEIDGASWFPPWSRDRIRNMTETRPDWCISRQRAWGVPIPALKCESCANVMLDLTSMKLTEEIFAREGTDAWYIRPASDFKAPNAKCPKCGGDSFAKTDDILDVWFDSGSSQAAVLGMRPDLRWPADAYLEAVEQARGWFRLVAGVRGGDARGRAISQRHQPRPHARRPGPQDVEVAGQHGRRAGRGQSARRRCHPARVRVARCTHPT